MKREDLRGDHIFLIRGFLSAEECRELIEYSESVGYDEAPITTSRGFEMRKDIRNNRRVMVDNLERAAALYERAKPFLVPAWNMLKPVGLNERLRFYRYTVGQRFAPHYDGYYRRDNGEQSHFTFMVYLNEECEGGETKFFEPEEITVRPETGAALVFHHPQLHAGAMVMDGTKYVLRTDVMYGGD